MEQPQLVASAVVVVLILSALLAAPARAQGAYASLGAIGVVGQDHDADGLIDVVLLNVPVRVEWAGVLTLEVWLPAASEPLAMPLTVPYGNTLLHPAFSGAAFRDLGTDGPYTLSVDLRDPVAGYVMDAKTVTTPAWTAADFDPAQVTVAALDAPWFMEAEGGGLAGVMVLNYTLDVVDPGPYRLWTRVCNESGRLLVSGWDRRTMAAGTVSGAVQVDVSPLTTRGTDGPLNVTFSVVAVYGSVSVVVNSRSVLAPALPPGGRPSLWAYLLPGVTSDAVDVDADGVFDVFLLHAPVHMDRPGTVTVAGDLLNEPDEEAAPYASSPPAALPAGDSIVDVPFSAAQLNWSYVDGPLWGNLTLTVAQLPGYVDTMPFTTGVYHWNEMSPAGAVLMETAWPGPEDPDADGLAEWMTIGLRIDVAREGDYFLENRMGTYPETAYANTGQYLHLEPGTIDLAVRISGIRGSRMAVGTWDSALQRLDAYDEPIGAFGNGWGPATNPAVFEGRDLAILNGTVTTADGVAASALVTAVRPSDAFSVSAVTDAEGRYLLPLYNGTFTVLAESLAGDGASTALNVTLAGDTVHAFALPSAPRTATYDAAMAAWDAATVDVSVDYGGTSAAARVYADLYGNFDGVANATELAFYARYPVGPVVPTAWPTAAQVPRAGGLSLRVDGRELAPGLNRVTVVSGEGPIDAATPVSATLRADLHGPAAVAAGSHLVSVALPGAGSGTTALSLTLPSEVVWSEANGSTDATVTRLAPRQWTVDPQAAANLHATTASAWIQTWDHDVVPPTAAASGPSRLERAEPATFDSSGSSDNLGITNRTWTVRANGTVVHGYSVAFTWTPMQIGTFDVGLRVQDAAGLWAETNLTVRVVDTTPPAAPTGLVATPSSDGGGTRVDLTWTSVVADDLDAYRVYRSADDGATFTFLGRTVGTTAAFTDATASAGATYLYRVTAVDRYGNEGAPSLTAQAVVPAAGGKAAPLDVGLVLGIAVLVVAAAGVATYLIWQRRKGQEPPSGGPPAP